MKSAFECFQHAAKCEDQAKQATSEAGRTMLLETAKHWRTPGEQAKVKETNAAQGPLAAVRAKSDGERPKAKGHSKLRGYR
jgi:hypothetical protein